MNKYTRVLITLITILTLIGCKKEPTDTTSSTIDKSQTKRINDELKLKDLVEGDTISEKVESYISLLSVKQKVGQMIQAERNSAGPGSVQRYHLGSIISGAGQAPVNKGPETWAEIYNDYQLYATTYSDTGIPILYAIDAVHGHNAVLGATIFPHNIGLGAANDPDLMYKIGETTAEEMAITGVNWNFSPSVAVAENIQWGRTYESFGEDPALQESLVQEYVRGLQEHDRVATAKHFIGDGGTSLRNHTKGEWSIDQGNTKLTLDELKEVHMPGYIEAIEAGVDSVMISYSSFNGIKMHQNKELITGLLKEELGFNGIVISDYEAIKQIPNADYYQQLVLAINAGIDMVMEPITWKDAYNHIIDAVENGDIEEGRIDDAVRRILTVKFENNLFDQPMITYDESTFNSDEHKEIARESVRKSLVLLKNNNQVLPLQKNDTILLMGPGSDNIKLQAGGWTVRWQGAEQDDTLPGTSILDGFETMVSNSGDSILTNPSQSHIADVAVVVLAETPYAEGYGDNGYLDLEYGGTGQGSHTAHPENIKALNEAKDTGLPIVVILLSGRPMLVNNHIDDWDAFVAAWLPGSEGGSGIADVLFGDYDFTGTLPVTWPRHYDQFDDSVIMTDYAPDDYMFPYGYGLQYSE